jgi:hypothetical protein
MEMKNIKIQHETFGVLLEETFSDSVQFKLFLKMINASLEQKSDLDFFNGVDFLIHIPYKHLVSSLILTSKQPYTLTEHFTLKNKIES